jgi:hypothetical protein
MTNVETTFRACMPSITSKPRLVFFLRRCDAEVPEFLRMHVRDHLKCLSECFILTVIQADFDYLQI